MRCPDCGIFVSYGGDYEPEIESEEISGTELSGEVRVVLDCAECGTELKESSMEYEVEFEHDCALGELGEDENIDDQFEIGSTSTAFSKRRQTKDRHGKPITNPRYQRTYYGAEITTTIKCTRCEEEFDMDTKVEEMASSFEEL